MLAVGAINETHEGRWLSPDLLGGDITNPQSLDRYAYALNNPATLTDPTGLGPCPSTNDPDGSVTTNCTVSGTAPGISGPAEMLAERAGVNVRA